MSARATILDGIRRANGQRDGARRKTAPAEKRLENHPRNIVPARTDGDHAQRVELFVAMAEAAAASVARVSSPDDVPEAVQAFLRTHNLPAKLTAAPESALDGIDWARAPLLEVARGRPDPAETLTGVTGAVAGIAETGTLMLASGPDRPTAMNFLPDNHIAVLRAGDVVGPYEEAWDILRGLGDGAPLPRTVNMITGPSRTGDIEQKIQLGAHGPRRLHIVLIEDGGP